MSRPASAQPLLLAGAVASASAFAVLARVATRTRPPRVDRACHDLAVAAYDRSLELAQLPVEIVGLPGIYLPLAAIGASRLRRRGHRGGGTIVGAAAAGWIALRLIRLVNHRKRPPRPAHRGPKSEGSFPSGHTTGMTALAIAAAAVLEREGVLSPLAARALGVGVPVAVAFNRVYVREHWLTDVVGGWLLGGAVALACVGAGARPRRRDRNARHRRPMVRRARVPALV